MPEGVPRFVLAAVLLKRMGVSPWDKESSVVGVIDMGRVQRDDTHNVGCDGSVEVSTVDEWPQGG